MTYTTEIEPAVMDVLRRSTAGESILVLPPNLDRKLYVRVDKVLKNLGGKWNTRAKGHIFSSGAPRDVLERVLDNGSFTDKRRMGFFQTPEWLAQRMRDTYTIHPTDVVLEPSAGHGRLIDGLRVQRIVAIDIDPDNVEVLRAIPNVSTAHAGDFLELAPLLNDFNLVLMNPPFAGNQDIKHVLAAWGCLAPGGRLIAILSPHYTFADDGLCREFREWVQQVGADSEELPEGTFKDAGTMIRTRLLWAVKEV